jgi:hypothetical protein
VLAVLEIGFYELFSQADFELQASWSMPPEELGLQMWATGAWLFKIFSCLFNRALRGTVENSDI